MFTLNVQPGVISAIFFVVFDLLCLALVDYSLARLVCAQYHRRIAAGGTMRVRSVDLPGITSFLLDNARIPVNVAALAMKLTCIALVFSIGLGLDAGVVPREISRTVIIVHNMSAEVASTTMIENIFEPWRLMQHCRMISYGSSEVVYYSIALDLHEEEGGLNTLNVRSQICLSALVVHEPVVFANVIGCTGVHSAECWTARSLRRHADLNETMKAHAILETSNISYSYEVMEWGATQTAVIWPEYHNGSLCCLTSVFGIYISSRRLTACLLVASNALGNTIFEHWTYEETRREFKNKYAGPVFQGPLEFAKMNSIVYLAKAIHTGGLDWVALSSEVVALIAKAELRDVTVRLRERPRPVAKLSLPSVCMAVGLVLFATVSSVVVRSTVGRDRRPQFNSIDGLSSIGEEERSPSGQSYCTGPGMVRGGEAPLADGKTHFEALSST